ncbi:MAG TPA: hypothetical protein VFG02_05915 [Nitrospirota bacterium]|nr:hypothetical protein [Nitrospirota bacterium]
MKRKDKVKKKPDMPEFSFKEFTPEESNIYEEAVNKYREAIAAGKTLKQAYENYPIIDPELKSLIQADFLKILIAESHFGKGQSLEDVAKVLDVSLDLIKETHARMLQEAGVTAANQFGQEFGSFGTKAND